MSRSAGSIETLPPVVSSALEKLGENLAIARTRRKESQRSWARRLGVSVPTLIRLERGDPRVAMGVYASALWLMGRASGLAEIASPVHDQGALEQDVRAATERRAVRAAASLAARLATKSPKSPKNI